MLEIYNEECKDLLGKGAANLAGPGGSKRPPVSHDEKGQTTVAGVDAFDVRSEERLKILMAKAAGAKAASRTCEGGGRLCLLFQSLSETSGPQFPR